MQCIGVFARLDLADMLADGPKDVDWLARKAGAHAPSLLRLLRALVRLEIVNQVDERTFALAPLGEPLRRDHPRSLARLAAQRTDPWWQAWGVLYHSIKTGGTAFEHAYGAPFFSTLSSDPEAAARFDDYMSELAVPLATSVAQVIDLAGTAPRRRGRWPRDIRDRARATLARAPRDGLRPARCGAARTNGD